MNIYVRQDYKTVSEAVSAANDGDTIIIPSGIYREKITVTKKDLSFVGEGVVTLTYDGASGEPDRLGGVYDTFSSATVTITETAENFKAENITFENSYNRADGDVPVTQAVALSCGADGAAFYNCNFLGWQDTLYLHGDSKQFFLDCYIEGSVDFIFGDSSVLFEDCDINCLRSKSYITAANTGEDNPVGFVFYHCYISANSNCGEIYLGRPWRAERPGINSATAFIECTYNADMAPAGWLPWRLEVGTEKSNTRYFEYKNTDSSGSLADTRSRAEWSKQLTRDEAEDIMRYIGKFAKYPDDVIDDHEEHCDHEHHQ